jgi:nicotinamidase-related amidase
MRYTFVEIDMRNDFADDPRASLPVPGTYAIVGKMRVLEEKADMVIEVYDNHEEDDPVTQKEFEIYPPHCVPGTWGHERISGLYTPEFGSFKQFPKNNLNTWDCQLGKDSCTESAGRFQSVIQESETVVVGGVVTGICIKAFVEGIIERGLAEKTIVISDCVANLEGVEGIPSTGDLFSSWKDAGIGISSFEDFVKEHLDPC